MNKKKIISSYTACGLTSLICTEWNFKKPNARFEASNLEVLRELSEREEGRVSDGRNWILDPGIDALQEIDQVLPHDVLRATLRHNSQRVVST